ncbi:outer membrane lipoprotein-sorting protein [uncultured Desulfosarcina sp.]|uniref:outer membrane lipoprotein-sorting protein n=1 Tax=uncultured Desulfosarcina sp. TaxID=218289 RepID=UPI0029C671DD|nr:outer membrane lipoprotein-sorting protein [uncultured Desulfosarcina sp.]
MKNILSMATAILLLSATPLAAAMTGRQIMEQSDALAQPDTAESRVVMLIHKGGRAKEKEFGLQAKQFGPEEDRVKIAFIRPSKITLLTHSRKKQPDNQWLRLSSGKVKRIALADKGKPFVNSHFYYEDLSGIDIDDYIYTLLGKKEISGEPCYEVEAVTVKEDKVYDKLILYPRKSDCFVLRVDFYLDGEFHKFLENAEIQTVDGILTPFKVTMSTADGQSRTELLLKALKYNEDLPDSRFRKEALR